MSDRIEIGQVWQDLDPRASRRQVKISGIIQLPDSGKIMVEYRAHHRTNRSERERFLKAFKLMA